MELARFLIKQLSCWLSKAEEVLFKVISTVREKHHGKT
jgi:hypothetical protein